MNSTFWELIIPTSKYSMSYTNYFVVEGIFDGKCPTCKLEITDESMKYQKKLNKLLKFFEGMQWFVVFAVGAYFTILSYPVLTKCIDNDVQDTPNKFNKYDYWEVHCKKANKFCVDCEVIACEDCSLEGEIHDRHGFQKLHKRFTEYKEDALDYHNLLKFVQKKLAKQIKAGKYVNLLSLSRHKKAWEDIRRNINDYIDTKMDELDQIYQDGYEDNIELMQQVMNTTSSHYSKTLPTKIHKPTSKKYEYLWPSQVENWNPDSSKFQQWKSNNFKAIPNLKFPFERMQSIIHPAEEMDSPLFMTPFHSFSADFVLEDIEEKLQTKVSFDSIDLNFEYDQETQNYVVSPQIKILSEGDLKMQQNIVRLKNKFWGSCLPQ